MSNTIPGLLELLFILPLVILAGLLPVIVFWKICSKAGYPGPLGLLMLLPVANILLPIYLAFADWPVLKRARMLPPGL